MRAILVSLIVIALFGCAPNPVHGFVVERKHEDAWTQIIYIGKIPQYIFHPERWILDIRGEDERGQSRTIACDVSKPTWDKTGVGDPFSCENP